MTGSDNQLIERFYAAFAAHDGATMAACYAPDARFSDPVFPDLRGDQPGNMWRMLTGASDDLRIELLEHEASDDHGSAHWRAHYTFTQTGRPVVNDVRASFRFERRADRRAPRRVRLPPLGAAGAGDHGAAARVDADRALEGPQTGRRAAGVIRSQQVAPTSLR